MSQRDYPPSNRQGFTMPSKTTCQCSECRLPVALAALAALLSVALLLWSLAIGAFWLAWAHTFAVTSTVAALATVTLALYLTVRGNWRARVIAAFIFAALAALGALVTLALTR
jgi:hypothetical protein